MDSIRLGGSRLGSRLPSTGRLADKIINTSFLQVRHCLLQVVHRAPERVDHVLGGCQQLIVELGGLSGTELIIVR